MLMPIDDNLVIPLVVGGLITWFVELWFSPDWSSRGQESAREKGASSSLSPNIDRWFGSTPSGSLWLRWLDFS
jgi:hypothetical protein